MPPENLEIAARLYAMYERGDIDGMLAEMDPDIEVEERIAHVAWMRDGTPYRIKVFSDRERALEAAGLSNTY